MRREPILFVFVLLVLGLMTYSLLQRTAPRAARLTGGKQLEEFVLATGDPVVSLPSTGEPRDLLRRPNADERLPPLQLPDPEVAQLPVLLPPPMPDCGPMHWSDFLLQARPRIVGGLDDLVEVDGSAVALAGLEESTAEAFVDQDDQYRKTYDWIRLNPLATLYGHLLGENRFDYCKGDVLRFRQVDPHTGKDRFGDVEFGPDEYEDFGFAQTLRNQIELGVREQRQRMSAARVPEVATYVHWLLDQGLAEPIAFDYAEELALKTVELAPNDVNNWMLLGEVWEKTFQLDRAFALYAVLAGEKLPPALPDFGVNVESGRFSRSARPRVQMGRILRRLDLLADAEKQFQQAVQLAAGDAVAPLEYGLLLLEQGRIAEASAHLKRAMAMQGQRNSVDGLKNALALGRLALAAGNWAEAAQAYADAERAAGSNTKVALQAQAGSIAVAYLSGDFARARELAGSAVDRFGADGRLLYLRGLAEAAIQGAAGEVVRDLRAAVAAQPLDAAPALSAQAFWLDQAGEGDAAQEILGQALEMVPSHLYSRYLRAHWATRDGDLAGARAELQDLVQIAPQCAAVFAEYGSLLFLDGAYAQAEVAFRNLEELFPAWVQNRSQAPAWAGLVLRHGLNLLQLQQTEEAISAFDQALSLDENLIAARNAKAKALYLEGDLDTAVAEFAYVQDVLREQEENPQFQYAQRWQQRILEHAQLRRWVDAFDGKRLRPGWDTQSQARSGVEPKLEDGALWIRGSHDSAAETQTFRTVLGVAFRSFEADWLAGMEHRAEASIFLALQNRSKVTWSFQVTRDREGLIGWTMTRGTRSEQGRSEIRLSLGQVAHVSFQLNREPKQPVLTVRINDEILFSDAVTNLRNPTGRMAMGIGAKTAHALPVAVSVDNVQIVYAIP